MGICETQSMSHQTSNSPSSYGSAVLVAPSVRCRRDFREAQAQYLCTFHTTYPIFALIACNSVFHQLLNIVVSKGFYTCYIKLPIPDQTPLEICDNLKLYPFFKGCLGAIDGTHIDAFVPNDALAHYQNQKGGITQNVLAACTFDMHFCYILSGWEGSADGHIFDDAQQSDFAIAPGCYYLADVGFGTCDVLLVPY